MSDDQEAPLREPDSSAILDAPEGSSQSVTPQAKRTSARSSSARGKVTVPRTRAQRDEQRAKEKEKLQEEVSQWMLGPGNVGWMKGVSFVVGAPTDRAILVTPQGEKKTLQDLFSFTPLEASGISKGTVAISDTPAGKRLVKTLGPLVPWAWMTVAAGMVGLKAFTVIQFRAEFRRAMQQGAELPGIQQEPATDGSRQAPSGVQPPTTQAASVGGLADGSNGLQGTVAA